MPTPNQLDPEIRRARAQKFRRHYGCRPSHFGKPESYYRRPNTPKRLRTARWEHRP